MKKKTLIIGIIFLGIVFSASLIYINQNKSITKLDASYQKISGLEELKQRSDIIAEVQGTENYKFIDYSGIKLRITTVKVIEIIKGDKSLKEINIAQTEGLDTEKPPQNSENLLIFLRKSPDINDTYIPLGGSQGTYDIVERNSGKSISSVDSKNNSTIELKPNSIVNENIIKDLKENYSDIKKNLAD